MAIVPIAETPARGKRAKRAFLLHSGVGITILLLLIVSSLWQMHVHDRLMQPSYSDLVTRWVGTRAALAGKDPYSDAVLPEMLRIYYGHYPLTPSDPDPIRQRFYYPGHMVVLLAPLAHLSWPAARSTFLFVTLLLLVLGLRACIEMYPPRYTRIEIVILIVLAVFSWPVLWGLRLQQPTLLIAAFLFLACFCLTKGWAGIAGTLLALATVKPQIVFPLLAWLAVWAVAHRAWRWIASFGITLAVLLLGAEKIIPGWFSHWYTALRIYAQFTKTDPPLENLFGHWVGLALTLLIAGSICLSLWRLRTCSAKSAAFAVATSLVLALTVVILPTHLTMIYNQVLLFPACLFLISARPADRDSRIARRIALALIVLTFALPPLAILGEMLLKPSIVWDALPFMNNSPMSAVVALALAVMVSATPKSQRQSSTASFERLLASEEPAR